MTSAASSAARRRRAAPRRAPADRRDVVLAWPRIRRILVVLVVLALASSYVSPVVDWFGARAESGRQQERLEQLTQDRARLVAERDRLRSARGVTEAARGLGMVRDGERSYVVRGLPGR